MGSSQPLRHPMGSSQLYLHTVTPLGSSQLFVLCSTLLNSAVPTGSVAISHTTPPSWILHAPATPLGSSQLHCALFDSACDSHLGHHSHKSIRPTCYLHRSRIYLLVSNYMTHHKSLIPAVECTSSTCGYSQRLYPPVTC